MKLNPIHEMFDPGTHHVCQQLSRNRIESCECTFCGEKAKLKDILLLHVVNIANAVYVKVIMVQNKTFLLKRIFYNN